jgi:hypothetical protein
MPKEDTLPSGEEIGDAVSGALTGIDLDNETKIDDKI